MEKSLTNMATQVLDKCRARGLRLVTAESCTGGLIAATLTDIPGSSDVFDRGFVTYSNQAKCDMLGVDPDLIAQQGAVSELVARHMAQGALLHSGCDIAVAVTGVAGPGGGSDDKPVGTVHIVVAESQGTAHHELCAFGNLSRSYIRKNTVLRSFSLLDGIISIPVSI
jgi:nicotinamide-nucleotide amidase